jgi:ATP-binding cassette subfamily C (CFTR/MRP) protein 1
LPPPLQQLDPLAVRELAVPARQGEVAISVRSGSFNWGLNSKKATDPAYQRPWKALSKSEKSTASKLGMAEPEWNQMLEKNSDTNPFQLQDVSLSIKAGQTVAVVGAVGTGKSSLLAAILGEMEVASKTPVERAGSVAYAAQTAFIVNGTVKENITCPPHPGAVTPLAFFHSKSILYGGCIY